MQATTVKLTDTVDRLLAAARPPAGAVVMGTGIVSLGLAVDDQGTLSLVIAGIAAALWLALGLLLGVRVLRQPLAVSREARSAAALTEVAATAVLGSRALLLGWGGVAAALLGLASGTWLVLIGPVLRNRRPRTSGTAFMITVSTQSIAALAAQAAYRDHAPWLVYAAVALFALGMAFYLLVLTSFDFGQLIDGPGDHWVSGGALAISTLAVAEITLAAEHLQRLGGTSGPLATVTLALWAASIALLPILLAGEAIRPRARYDGRRWSTVFPVGMYAASSFAAGRAADVSGLVDFARVWVWIGLALWAVVFWAMLWRASRLAPLRAAGSSRISGRSDR